MLILLKYIKLRGVWKHPAGQEHKIEFYSTCEMIKSKFANLFFGLYCSGRGFFFPSSFKESHITIRVLTCAIFELMQRKECQPKFSAPILPVILHTSLWSQPNLADLSNKTRTEPIQLHENFSLLNLIKEEVEKSNLLKEYLDKQWHQRHSRNYWAVASPFLSNTLSTAKSIKYFIIFFILKEVYCH